MSGEVQQGVTDGHGVSDGVPDRGFLYLAWGAREYFDEAIASCRSLKAVAPSAHVTLATVGTSAAQRAELSAIFDEVIEGESVEVGDQEPRPAASSIGFTFKVRSLRRCAPYARTFFVDTDTHFTEDPSGLFALLDHFDLAVGSAPADLTAIRDSSGAVITGYTPYNTGVILFDRDRTVDLFSEWERRQDEALLRSGDRPAPDQTTFAEALLESNCRFYVMQTSWNARLPYPERLAGPVTVVHARPSELGGMSLERVAARVNQTDEVRIWMPGVNTAIHRDMGVHRWLWLSIRGVPLFIRQDVYRLARGAFQRLPASLRRALR